MYKRQDETSDWVGKLYNDSAAEVLEYQGDWAKIKSGDAEGYVPASSLYIGEDAEQHEDEFQKEKMKVEAYVPVSYTHLDVYKRQGLPVACFYPICQNILAWRIGGAYRVKK